MKQFTGLMTATFLMRIVIACIVFVPVFAMKQKLTDEDIEHEIQEAKIKHEKLRTQRGVDVFDRTIAWVACTASQKQIFGYQCTSLQDLIDFEHEKISQAQAIYPMFNLPYYRKEIEIMQALHAKIFDETLHDAIFEDVYAHYGLAYGKEAEKEFGKGRFELPCLWKEFEEHVFSVITIEQALDCMTRFDDLLAKGIRVFKDLSDKGIGLSAKILCQQWEKRKQDVCTSIKKCKRRPVISKVVKRHIQDFLLLLIQPFHLDPNVIWG